MIRAPSVMLALASLLVAAGAASAEEGAPQRQRGSQVIQRAAYVTVMLAAGGLSTSLALSIAGDGAYDDWLAEERALTLAYSRAERATEAQLDDLWGAHLAHEEEGRAIGVMDALAWVSLGLGIAAAVTAIVLFIADARRRRGPRPAGGERRRSLLICELNNFSP